jgi:Protein of unknown function (DUF2800)
LNCSGYVEMISTYPDVSPDEDNEVREDGTAAHWLAKEKNDGRVYEDGFIAPNKRKITREMQTGIDLYLSTIEGWRNVVAILEQPVSCSIIYPGMKGTPDAWAVNPAEKIIYIGDFKFGFVRVEAWENLQLMCYAWSIIHLLNIADTSGWRFVFTIVQPRDYMQPVRVWEVAVDETKPLLYSLQHAAAEAMHPSKRMCRTGDWCIDCHANYACDAFMQSTHTMAEKAKRPSHVNPTGAQMADEMKFIEDVIERLQARFDGLQTQAKHYLSKGEHFPYYNLVPTRPATIFTSEPHVIEGLGQLYGVNVFKDPELKSPAQLRAVLGEETVARHTRKVSSGVKVVRMTDRAIQKAFSKKR